MKPETKRLPDTIRALRHRNYRLFISGQIISQIGYWMQSTAQAWLVFPILTKDRSLLGLVSFSSQIPVLILGLAAGAVADSVNRHRLIITTQIFLMGQSILLATLTILRWPDGQLVINYPIVLGMAFLAGSLQAFDIPARQAFLPQMVPKEDLQNAIALNSLAFNTARIIGPSIAAALIGWFATRHRNHIAFGEAVCFSLNALSFLAVLISLLRMRVQPQPPYRMKESRRSFLAEGLHYVRSTTHIRDIMIFAGAMALFGIPYVMLIQIFATDALRGNAQTYGLLMTCIGVGAATGGILLAGRTRIRGTGRIIAAACSGFSVIVMIFAQTSHIAIAAPLIACAGMCMVVTMIGSMTLVQHLTDDHVRGRVMSLYNMVTTGLMPFGFLMGGLVAQTIGIRYTLMINAVVCLCAAVFFWLRIPAIRQSVQLSREAPPSSSGSEIVSSAN